MVEEVKATLSEPIEVRTSQDDENVFLYYRIHGKYYLCVVARHLNDHGFIVTSYLNTKIKEGNLDMEKITITYDKVGNTLDIWFGKPRKAICEEIGGGVILKKDRSGKIIGFEKLNYVKQNKMKNEIASLPLEVNVI